jgi:hypothetical protein
MDAVVQECEGVGGVKGPVGPGLLVNWSAGQKRTCSAVLCVRSAHHPFVASLNSVRGESKFRSW